MIDLQVLDTTLRDGSCAIDFRYEENDVTTVTCGLAASAVPWIEVGHGVSAGLSYPPFTPPKVADGRTFALARRMRGNAKIGTLVVPALTEVEVLPELIAHLDFVRLAPAPAMLSDAIPYLRAARKTGKKVFLQLVKTHVHDVGTIAETVRPFVAEGLDALYVVDSAGCMTPSEVTRYVTVLRQAFDVPLGFHGHDNTSLAVANALAAIDAGATFVDGTLGGIGRGAGSTQLELLVSILQAKGHAGGIAVDSLFELSQYLWRRFPQAARGIDPVEAYYGVHKWDSTSKDDALAAAAALEVSPFAFIKSLVGRATGPWITKEDIAETAAALRNVSRTAGNGMEKISWA